MGELTSVLMKDKCVCLKYVIGSFVFVRNECRNVEENTVYLNNISEKWHEKIYIGKKYD